MSKAPETITTNWMWDHDADGEDIKVRISVVNHGRFDHFDTEECGCVIAVYALEECGGPADLVTQPCGRFAEWDCSGYRFTVGAFTVTV